MSPAKPLRDLVVVVKSGLSSHYAQEGGVTVPFIKLSDLQKGRINAETVDRISVKETDLLEKSRMAPGDIIFTVKGTNFRGVIADESIRDFMISANMVALTLSDKILPEIVVAYLNSPAGQREIQSRASGGVTRGLSIKSLLEIPIPIPPIEQQKTLSLYLSLAREYEENLIKESELVNKITDAVIAQIMRRR